jgi:hypothetical protein
MCICVPCNVWALVCVCLSVCVYEFSWKAGVVRGLELSAGRLLPSTKLQNLMHEFITAKHGIRLEPASLTQTKITYAKLFERFKKVAGMTGTAQESANAFWENYRLSVRLPLPHILHHASWTQNHSHLAAHRPALLLLAAHCN